MAATDLSAERDDIQGLVASGYGHLPHAAYLLFSLEDAGRAAGWLRWLADTITTARTRVERRALNVALSHQAIEKLGLVDEALAAFSAEFAGGMADDAHRRRSLGDVGPSAPEHWDWGGCDSAPVDVLLMLFGETPADVRELIDQHLEEAAGARLVRRLDGSNDTFDHFGFRDGISQPWIDGLRRGPAAQTVRTGEFVLGYTNEYGQRTDRPLVPASEDRDRVLPDDLGGSGMRDLGRNGTYLVFRQLSQDVPAFWQWVDGAANGNGHHPEARAALAAQLVGRWPGGAPLTLSPEHDSSEFADASDFGYHRNDADGLRCPLGAHVRRSHPRDSLDPNPGSSDSIAIDKHHRLLRRGRKYGPPLGLEAALREQPGGEDKRGLHFVCLVANIERQFEFVQHTWVNSPKFDGLYDDPDPLVAGGRRQFTVQASPVRRRYRDLPAFVQTRGGGYFFMPGVRALRYLASLPS